jgi:hypothetical protein
MLASIATSGWPWAARTLMTMGVRLDTLFEVAALSGVLATLLLLTLFISGRSTEATTQSSPAAHTSSEAHSHAPM